MIGENPSEITGSKKDQGSDQRSVLAFLHPTFMDELRFGVFKDSINIQGSYRMNLRQPSRQPEHSREYQTGDPIRLIDWKAYAKHNELIIREVQDEASANVVVAIDTSSTMMWPDHSVPTDLQAVQKFECALRVGMALAYAHLKVGDFVQIYYTNRNQPLQKFKPRSSTDVVATFDRVASQGFSTEVVFQDCLSESNWPTRTDRKYFISDLLYLADPNQETLSLGPAKNLQIYHLLSHLETDTTWIDNDSFYHDQGEVVTKEYQGKTLNQSEGYDRCLQNWKVTLRQLFRKSGTNYFEIDDLTSVHSFMHSITI